jgi:tetratricopeptide (TPR) repeat protein
MEEGRMSDELPGELWQCAQPVAVGVVIPVFNRATVILSTLESVAQQTCPPQRLVVVDDGSTDQSAVAIQTWIEAAAPPFDVQLIRAPHRCAAAARNVGYEYVGDLPLVAFLDSDDIWPVDFLERTAQRLTREPLAVAVSTDRQYLNGEGISVRFDDCSELASQPLRWMFQHGAGIASCTLLRKAAVDSTRLWPEELAIDCAEDSLFFAELALRGSWLHAPGEAVRFHLGNAESCGEEGNLSVKYPDGVQRWAVAFERVLSLTAGRISASQMAELRPFVAAFWYRAGKQFDQNGDRSQAIHCYDRALQFQPTLLKAWSRRGLRRAG